MCLHQPCKWYSGSEVLLTFPRDISARLLPYSAGVFSTKLKQINRKPTENRFLYGPVPVIIKFHVPQFALFWPWTWWCSDFSCNDQPWGTPCSLLLLLLTHSVVTADARACLSLSGQSSLAPPAPPAYWIHYWFEGLIASKWTSEYLYIVYLNSIF